MQFHGPKSARNKFRTILQHQKATVLKTTNNSLSPHMQRVKTNSLFQSWIQTKTPRKYSVQTDMRTAPGPGPSFGKVHFDYIAVAEIQPHPHHFITAASFISRPSNPFGKSDLIKFTPFVLRFRLSSCFGSVWALVFIVCLFFP